MFNLCTSHGRLFLFNVMVTSTCRAKLSEYALDPYLKLTRGGLGSAGGYELLPSKQHPATSVLFLSPEKCSGKIAAVVQPQQLPTTAETIAPRRGREGDLRRLVQRSRALQRRTATPIAPSDAQPAQDDQVAQDEPKTKSTRLLGEQRADVWAFGCVLASLALHQKRAKAGLDRRRATDDMDGWDEYKSLSKDRPGRCSCLKGATEAVAEDRPRGQRRSSVERKFKALAKLSHSLRSSRCAASSGASCSSHDESSSNAPKAADAPLTSAPPSPPTSPADAGATPALARVIAHQTSTEEWSLEQPRAEISEAVRTQLSEGQLQTVQSRLIGCGGVTQQVSSRATIAPALQRVSTGQPQGAESGPTPEAPTLPARAALHLGAAATPRRVRFELGRANAACGLRQEQSRLSTLVESQPASSNEAAMAPPVPPTRYVLMLRLCQGKVSLLDGVTPSCCPRPLLQLATQCCTRSPEERPSLPAVLEQLQGKVLLAIDAAAHGAGVGAQRPLPALEEWCDAVERTLLGKEPARDEGGGALGPAAAHGASSDHNRSRGCCSAETPATCGGTSTHEADDAHRANHRKRAVFTPLPPPAPTPSPL